MTIDGVCNSQCVVSGAELCSRHEVQPLLEEKNTRIAEMEAQISGLRQDRDEWREAAIEDAKDWEAKRDAAEERNRTLSEALVRTGKWTPLGSGYLMCMVCCTGMRCEREPDEPPCIRREDCPNCLGKSGDALSGAVPPQPEPRYMGDDPDIPRCGDWYKCPCVRPIKHGGNHCCSHGMEWVESPKEANDG